jgi:hypothetical protein
VLVGDCTSNWLCHILRTNSKGTTMTEIRAPDDGTQEVPKHVTDCVTVVSHFSACKVALII